MEKRSFGYVGILFAALCFMVTACHQGLAAGKGTGEVRIVIGGGVARSVDDAGLPLLDDTNTKITVTGEDGNILGAGTTSVTLHVDTGKKIIIKAVVTAATGIWRGSAEHTVTAGINTVAVKLSKAPKGVANLFFSTAGNKTVLKLEGANTPFAEITGAPSRLSSELITVRDGIGRLYVLAYDATVSKAVIRRFTIDATEDTDFNGKLATALAGVTPVTIAADTKTNTLFIFSNKTKCYAVQEKNGTVTLSNQYDIKSIDSSVEDVQAAGAYNGTLFTVGTVNPLSLSIRAYTVSLSDTTLTLTAGGSATISAPVTAGSEVKAAKCTGVFATKADTVDKAEVYCLIGQKKTGESCSFYAVGKIVQYEYSGNGLVQKREAGFKSDSQMFSNGGIAFTDDAFSYPAAFIGYDEETLYIADDGADIQKDDYIDWRMNGNKNRIAAFNRKTGAVSFENSGADGTWNTEYDAYPATKIPRLSWGKQSATGFVNLNMKTVSDSIKSLVQNINTRQRDKLMTARDGAGNVYVLYFDNTPAAQLHLERFSADGTKDNNFGTAKTGFSFPATGITDLAVDFKTADVFLLKRTRTPTGTDITAYMAKSSDSYAAFSQAKINNLPSDSGTSSSIDAVAAFDGTLFFVIDVTAGVNDVKKLYAYKMQTVGSFAFTTNKAETELPELHSGGRHPMICTGLFADRQGVYGLLSQQNTGGTGLYALGKIVRYTYDGSTTLTPVSLTTNNNGLNPAAANPGSIGYNAQYFSNPVGFLGYDGDNLYIADDGVDICEDDYIGWRIAGQKDRIATFNRKTGVLEFLTTASDATWFAEYREYPPTKIPRLWWEKQSATGFVNLKLKTLDGTEQPLVQNINTRQRDKLMTARDSSGNVYVLYFDNMPAAQLHLERFSADGTKDNNFGTAKTGFTLPDTGITDLAVDFKTADVFLLKRTRVSSTDTMITAYMAKADNGYASFSGPATVTMPDDSTSVTFNSVAAFDGTLFFAMDVEVGINRVKKLYAYKVQTAGSFAFTTDKTEAELSKLRDDDKNPMVCTGLFADRKGVYGLLAQKNVIGGAAFYALGKIVRYTYDGSTQLTPVVLSGNNSGLNPAAANPGSIGYDAQYLSYPAGFLGYDGDTLYIADDGVDITEVNENLHVNGNKDRIMAFDRKNNTLSASSLDLDGATWFKSYDKYTYPETKMLLWEKGSSQYWVGDNGTEAYSLSSALSTTPSQHLTDVFCYDQDGNLYVVVQEGSSYKVKRFTPTDSGFNSTGDMKIKDESERPVSIAVDVSGGTNILYYGINVVPVVGNLRLSVQKIEWSDHFVGEKEPQAFISAENEQLTALAANMDGVFVGVKQIYEETVGGDQIPKYRLKVKKFLKGKHADGSVTVVENASSYVDPDNPDTPIPNPQPYSSSQLPYIEYEEAINDLQVVEGTLYAITSKAEENKKWNNDAGKCTIDKFKMSSALYKIGKTAVGFSGSAEKLAEKSAVPPQGSNSGVGYGFYRFIAVKPKKLVIASDGAYDVNGHNSALSSNPVHNDNKVLTYDLDGNLNSPEEKNATGKFSKELQPGSGFNWE